LSRDEGEGVGVFGTYWRWVFWSVDVLRGFGVEREIFNKMCSVIWEMTV
jgi:hypothetical protein